MMAVVTHTMDATDVAASQFENHGTLVSTDLSHLAKVDELHWLVWSQSHPHTQPTPVWIASSIACWILEAICDGSGNKIAMV